VKSYCDVLEKYATHPEPKSAGPDGKPCGRSTRGPLTRRHAHARSIYYVGKESNFLEEVESGLLHDLDEVQEKYFDPNEDVWTEVIVPILRCMPKSEIARLTGVSERYVQHVRNRGKRRPSGAVRAKLNRAAAKYARERLGHDFVAEDISVCMTYLRCGHGRIP
jgi:hypothetical protein